METELFGHEKGSFTVAERAKDGLLKIAEGAASVGCSSKSAVGRRAVLNFVAEAKGDKLLARMSGIGKITLYRKLKTV